MCTEVGWDYMEKWLCTIVTKGWRYFFLFHCNISLPSLLFTWKQNFSAHLSNMALQDNLVHNLNSEGVHKYLTKPLTILNHSFNSGTTSRDNSIVESNQWYKHNTVIMILQKFEGLLAHPVLAVPPSVVIQTSHTTCQTSDGFLLPLQVHLALYVSGCTMPMKAHQISPGHSFWLY